MPHIVVKMHSGRSEEQKARLAEAITKAVMANADCAEKSVSIGIEDIAPDAWTQSVYQPEIAGKWDTLYKKPGYEPQ
jgi:4-oxalocrotonate tautomerase